MSVLTKDELIAISDRTVHVINHDHENGVLISQIYRGSNGLRDSESVIDEWIGRLNRLKVLIHEAFSTEEDNDEYL